MKETKKLTNEELYEICSQHLDWLSSLGETGKQADLSGCYLHGKDFRQIGKTEHHSIYLTNIKFREADLSGSEFDHYVFTSCDFSQADLSRCKFHDCSFVNCKMQEANLHDVACENCDFQRCDLTEASFSKAAFATGFADNVNAYSSFSDCVLRQTEFSHCFFEDIHFLKNQMIGTNLRETDFAGETLFAGNQMKRVNTFEADMSHTTFHNNTFENTKFIQTLFDASSFTQCQFDQQSDFVQCNVEHCDFRDTEAPRRFDKIDYIYGYDTKSKQFLHDVFAYDASTGEIFSRRLLGPATSKSLTMLAYHLKNQKPGSKKTRLLNQLLLKKVEALATMRKKQEIDRGVVNSIKRGIQNLSQQTMKKIFSK